ncbi:MAG: hypothetical protein PWR09_493 [Archaeoglobi archaeon]|nr:hypothetical protein [Archaeoglobi archaeon]
MKKIDFDDKDIAILCLCSLAIISIFVMGDSAKEIVLTVVSAIAGMVTGRKLGRGET